MCLCVRECAYTYMCVCVWCGRAYKDGIRRNVREGAEREREREREREIERRRRSKAITRCKSAQAHMSSLDFPMEEQPYCEARVQSHLHTKIR